MCSSSCNDNNNRVVIKLLQLRCCDDMIEADCVCGEVDNVMFFYAHMRRYSNTDFIMLTVLSVSVCVWCDMRTARINNNEIELQCFNTPLDNNDEYRYFFSFPISLLPFQVCWLWPLSCSDAHTDTVLLSKRQKKNYVVFGKTSIFRDFLCLFICLFFLSSRARFMDIFEIWGGRE